MPPWSFRRLLKAKQKALQSHMAAIAAGIAALLGKKKVSEAAPPVPSNTVESVKKDFDEIKESARR
jgi:hypothetical protein